jgi:hypothetical protein
VLHLASELRGNLTTISNSGASAKFYLSIGERDENALARSLADAGIAEPNAEEFAKLIASEEPESKN